MPAGPVSPENRSPPSEKRGDTMSSIRGMMAPIMSCWRPDISGCVSPIMRGGASPPARSPPPLVPATSPLIESHKNAQAAAAVAHHQQRGQQQQQQQKESQPVSPSSTPSTPQATTNIRTPHSNDVLCGRGGSSNRHIGNLNFRCLVAANKDMYVTLTKKQKMMVAREIVKTVQGQEPPGRFLQKDAETGLWFDIGLPRSLEKTSQALREKTGDKNEVMSDTGASVVSNVSSSASHPGSVHTVQTSNSAPSTPTTNTKNPKPPPIVIPPHLEAQFLPHVHRRSEKDYIAPRGGWHHMAGHPPVAHHHSHNSGPPPPPHPAHYGHPPVPSPHHHPHHQHHPQAPPPPPPPPANISPYPSHYAGGPPPPPLPPHHGHGPPPPHQSPYNQYPTSPPSHGANPYSQHYHVPPSPQGSHATPPHTPHPPHYGSSSAPPQYSTQYHPPTSPPASTTSSHTSHPPPALPPLTYSQPSTPHRGPPPYVAPYHQSPDHAHHHRPTPHHHHQHHQHQHPHPHHNQPPSPSSQRPPLFGKENTSHRILSRPINPPPRDKLSPGRRQAWKKQRTGASPPKRHLNHYSPQKQASPPSPSSFSALTSSKNGSSRQVDETITGTTDRSTSCYTPRISSSSLEHEMQSRCTLQETEQDRRSVPSTPKSASSPGRRDSTSESSSLSSSISSATSSPSSFTATILSPSGITQGRDRARLGGLAALSDAALLLSMQKAENK
mmetsp:Transcript_3080/g.4405  ORF Transcript_3080/g.4405 Transcript_3080/m.4405 type:complete len:722 (+) Transcript_3080:236-2401(+)